VVGAFGCQEAPQASSENPGTNNSEPMSVPAKEAAQTTQTTAPEAPANINKPPTTALEPAPEKITEPPITAERKSTKKIRLALNSIKTPQVKAKKASSKNGDSLIEAANHLKGSNLRSLAYGKLQEKLPDSNLEVADQDGVLVVTGTVPSPDELQKIAPIVRQLKGVKQVKVAAKVSNDKKPQQDNN
jgi:hypothetical protein